MYKINILLHNYCNLQKQGCFQNNNNVTRKQCRPVGGAMTCDVTVFGRVCQLSALCVSASQ